MRIAVVDRPIDVASLIAEVGDDSCGAVSVFLGCVRDINDGRPVTGIEYSAYHAMAEREMATIVSETATRFDISLKSIPTTIRSSGRTNTSGRVTCCCVDARMAITPLLRPCRRQPGAHSTPTFR